MRSVLFGAAIALIVSAASAQTADERLPVCTACHGAGGRSAMAGTPSLGAMPVNYVLTQLYMFREKIRDVAPMNAMAEGLTDADLRTLATAFNKLPAPEPAAALSAAEQEEGAALVAQHHCNSCHGPDLAGQAMIPRIAGQREDYLAASLAGYKNNSRRGYGAAMNEAAQEIKPDEIPKLARYVASFRAPN